MARRIEGLWFYVYSLFYVGIWNFLLIFTGLVLLGVYLYDRLFRDRHYYPSYEMPEPVDLGRPMRIAMFTNTYLAVHRRGTGLGRAPEARARSPGA